MISPKKLIEVALPIKEISAESVRDKSIRHGHISTLHLWWARRPLPVCRAVVFASLVPDPLDEHCPPAFREAVEELLGRNNNPGDPYKPYDDIPYTVAVDRMEDTLRNRLLMFIGKFSDKYTQNERLGKSTPAKDLLSDASLIKWDNKNNETIINKARKLIFVAHNATNTNPPLLAGEGAGGVRLLEEFDTLYAAIKTAEKDLYATRDRHIPTPEVAEKEAALHQAIEAFLDKMPRVFDPFAGGGAIPLEAARLGCRSYGNDINPVAHIIQKGSLEFPQKYGKPITYSQEEFIGLYGEECWKQQPQDTKILQKGEAVAIRIPNRLSFDVEYYAKKLLAEAEREIGHLYPADENGNKPIAYYWARVGVCSNPSCRAEVPLLKSFYMANTSSKQVYLKPLIEGNQIYFELKKGVYKEKDLPGWISRGNMVCPCCGSLTENALLKKQLVSKTNKDRFLVVIEEKEGTKNYRLPSQSESKMVNIDIENIQKPTEILPVTYTKAMAFCLWGYDKWGDVFSTRQLYVLQKLVEKLSEIKSNITEFETGYINALLTYLGILLDRGSVISTSFGRWDVSRENVQSPFSKQAIAMVFDYPEANLLGSTTGSLSNQLDWIIRYIESECESPFSVELKNASSGDKSQFPDKFLTTVVTDPPYFDAIAYADLSDFFYVWLKRTLGDVYPLNFATPQTPKTEECTALKHHHDEDKDKAKTHFESKLTEIFDAIEHQTTDIVSIMFAHQSTEAWTTLCNSILGARMNITGSWPVDTEMANRSLGLAGAVLASSVTVSARPAQRQGYGEYRTVKKAIEKTVALEVDELYRLGFRGADLLTACFGQAVSEFGQYEKVEKADGSEITVAELLEMARESAFNALLRGFEGDEFTKFYIGWLQLYGFVESDFDDAAKFSRVGLSINVAELFGNHILIKEGNKQTLGTYAARLATNKKLGENRSSHLIDQVHRAMYLYRGTNRAQLLEHIALVADNPESPFWRVVSSLCELLPSGTDDFKQATGLLANKDSLIRESKQASESKGTQGSLFE